jgi:hypothetical protein
MDQDQWMPEYPTETELYVLNKVIKDLTRQRKYLIETASKFKNVLGIETVNDMLCAAEDIDLQLQKAKDRFRYLKSKHPTPIWITQIINRLKLLLRKLWLGKSSCK